MTCTGSESEEGIGCDERSGRLAMGDVARGLYEDMIRLGWVGGKKRITLEISLSHKGKAFAEGTQSMRLVT